MLFHLYTHRVPTERLLFWEIFYTHRVPTERLLIHINFSTLIAFLQNDANYFTLIFARNMRPGLSGALLWGGTTNKKRERRTDEGAQIKIISLPFLVSSPPPLPWHHRWLSGPGYRGYRLVRTLFLRTLVYQGKCPAICGDGLWYSS